MKSLIEKVDALIDACRKGSLLDVKACVQELKSSNIDRPGSQQTTALQTAVWRNDLKTVQYLLSLGARPNTQDGESGWSALHRSLYFGHFRAAALLLESGASVQLEDLEGRTALDLLSSQLTPSSGVLLAAPSPGELELERGDLYSWGSGVNYQLGTGSTAVQTTPGRVERLRTARVVAVAAAKFHSAAITSEGELFTWGFGRGGRLGHPNELVHSGQQAVITPLAVAALSSLRVATVAVGKNHTLASVDTGDVFSWGRNRDGSRPALGYTAEIQPTPRKVGHLKAHCILVAAANKHSAALTSRGELFTWGANREGQLGYTSTSGGVLVDANLTPRTVDYLKGRELVHVSLSKRHSVVVDSEGDVFTWGHGRTPPKRVALAGAATVLAGGCDGHAPLRMHHASQRLRVLLTAAGGAHTVAITKCGAALYWASGDAQLRCLPVLALLGKCAITAAAGKTRSAVVTAEGDVYMWEGAAALASCGGLERIPSGTSPMLATSPGCGRSGSGSGAGSGTSPGFSGRSASFSNLSPGPGTSPTISDPKTPSAFTPQSQASPKEIGGVTGGVPDMVVQRVDGMRRMSLIAVGEKHSLAVQRVAIAVLPGISQAAVKVAGRKGALGPHDDDDSLEDGDEESNSSDEEVAGEMELPEEDDVWLGHTAAAISSTPMGRRGDYEAATGWPAEEPARTRGLCGRASAGAGEVPSLMELCEAAAAKDVDVCNAPYMMEAAAALGAERLLACCTRTLLRNLDAVLETGGPAALSEMPEEVLEVLEEAARSTERGAESAEKEAWTWPRRSTRAPLWLEGGSETETDTGAGNELEEWELAAAGSCGVQGPGPLGRVPSVPDCEGARQTHPLRCSTNIPRRDWTLIGCR
ncbi:hypothetical protein CYMTET_48143 [Cymbomonas tetramitiformis]|uniref:RCC1-like domain-containing protein n=1 Tax=Cymbomonas tetramitiformis TaxID=36881 RepID=A0AAE0BSY0_9CHLO|nr:hypothetical protein CYMTET_48143 [Cymbomonas tetramitiformis]